jgi:Xaa-Pro aminopeptidase
MQKARTGMTEAQIAARVYEIAHAANCEISFPITPPSTAKRFTPLSMAMC